MKAKELKKKLEEPKKITQTDYSQGLSTGLTLLNKACSGRTTIGLLPGHFYLLVGGSRAGKTMLARKFFAEASINTIYDAYHFIDDNPERGALMDNVKFFGKRMATRMRPPNNRGSSKTLEEFYDNIDDAEKLNEPFMYLLDSEDALSSEAEVNKAKKDKNIRRKNKSGAEEEEKIKGSYGDGKAKKNSSGLRLAHNSLEATNSILIMIKQERDNIGNDAFFNPKTRSGGRALTFYASLEFWFSVRKKITKKVRGNTVVTGSILRIEIKKNRIAGRDRTIEVPFYPGYGFDDLGSCVNYLIKWEHWKGSEDKGRVTAPEFDFDGSQEKLIQRIQNEGKEKDLKRIVSEVWDEVEESVLIKRKPLYE